jgi:hypothetical protein
VEVGIPWVYCRKPERPLIVFRFAGTYLLGRNGCASTLVLTLLALWNQSFLSNRLGISIEDFRSGAMTVNHRTLLQSMFTTPDPFDLDYSKRTLTTRTQLSILCACEAPSLTV